MTVRMWVLWVMAKLLVFMFALNACMSAPDGSSHSDVTSTHNSHASKVTKTQAAAPARDGNIAILEEFNAAKAKNTAQAYDLFIARHPEHTLAKDAKALKTQLNLSDKP